MPLDFSEDGAIGAGNNTAASSYQSNSSPVQATLSAGGSQPSYSAPPPPSSSPSSNNSSQDFFGGNGQLNSEGYNSQSQKKDPFTGQVMPWWMQDTGGFMRVGASFAEGGAVPDGDADDVGGKGAISDNDADDAGGMSVIQKALSSVDAVLAYGRQRHGLGGDQQQAPMQDGSNYKGGHDYENMHQSPNVEDRTNDPPTSGVEQAGMNFYGKANGLYEQAKGALGMNEEPDSPMAKSMGADDIDKTKTDTLGPGDGAINTEDEQ
jgi:hypothetical protein